MTAVHFFFFRLNYQRCVYPHLDLFLRFSLYSCFFTFDLLSVLHLFPPLFVLKTVFSFFLHPMAGGAGAGAGAGSGKVVGGVHWERRCGISPAAKLGLPGIHVYTDLP